MEMGHLPEAPRSSPARRAMQFAVLVASLVGVLPGIARASERTMLSIKAAPDALISADLDRRYYVAFASRPSEPFAAGGEKSRFGHSFVVLRIEEPSGELVVEAAVGWQATAPLIAATSALLTGAELRGPGELIDDRDTLRFAQQILSVQVSPDQFMSAFDVVQSFPIDAHGQRLDYVFGENDCVDLVIDVATAIGIVVPDRGLLNTTPHAYVETLLEANRPTQPPIVAQGPASSFVEGQSAEVLRYLALIESNPSAWVDLFFDLGAGGVLSLRGGKVYPEALPAHGRRGGMACAWVAAGPNPGSAEVAKAVDGAFDSLTSTFTAPSHPRAFDSPLLAHPGFWRAAEASEDACVSAWLSDPVSAGQFRHQDFPVATLLVRTPEPRAFVSGALSAVSLAPPDWPAAHLWTGTSSMLAARLRDGVIQSQAGVQPRALTAAEATVRRHQLDNDAKRHQFQLRVLEDLQHLVSDSADVQQRADGALVGFWSSQAPTVLTNSLWNASIMSVSMAAANQASQAIGQAMQSVNQLAQQLIGVGSDPFGNGGGGGGDVTVAGGDDASVGADGQADNPSSTPCQNCWTVQFRMSGSGQKVGPLFVDELGNEIVTGAPAPFPED